jgi:hypothetical protein
VEKDVLCGCSLLLVLPQLLPEPNCCFLVVLCLVAVQASWWLVTCYSSQPNLFPELRFVLYRAAVQARDEQDNPRLSGGDTFQVLLLPGKPATAPAVPLARQLGATASAAAEVVCSSHTQQQQHLGGTHAVSQTNQHFVEAGTAGGCVNATVDLGISGVEDLLQDLLQPEDSGMPPVVVTAVAVGEVQDNGDGSYSCSYSHSVAGPYQLHVLNGECT